MGVGINTSFVWSGPHAQIQFILQERGLHRLGLGDHSTFWEFLGSELEVVGEGGWEM